MTRFAGPLRGVVLLGAGILSALLAQGGAAQGSAEHDLLSALTNLRSRGCPGGQGTDAGLRQVAPLQDTARRLARGATTTAATQAAGYRAKTLFHAQLRGYRSTDAVAATIARQYCQAITNTRYTDIGLHREGDTWWVVLAEPFDPPPAAASAQVSARVLALTNEARARPRQCGSQSFGAAPPVAHNRLLERAAAAHAADMARHGLLRHEGSDGSTPAQRVTGAGYRWRSVGENVASGQTTAEQVVQGWLRSPGHCATLMDPAFTGMGVAYATNLKSEAGVYWAQVFGRPL